MFVMRDVTVGTCIDWRRPGPTRFCLFDNMEENCNASLENLKFIKLYEERPLLWDTRLPEYYSATETKAQLWREICEQLSTTRGRIRHMYVKTH